MDSNLNIKVNYLQQCLSRFELNKYTNITLKYDNNDLLTTINTIYYYIPSSIIYNDVQYNYSRPRHNNHLSGGYSVILFYKNNNGEKLALKYINITVFKQKNIIKLIDEIYLFEKLLPKMSSIVEYYGFTYSIIDSNLYLGILLEKMDTDLFEYALYKSPSPDNPYGYFELREIKHIIKTIAFTIHKLHAHNIVYGDLKPENILVKNNVYKLCDFNCSYHSSLSLSSSGTLLFKSPEQLTNKPITSASDVWSLGILTMVLVTGEDPPYNKLYDKKEPVLVREAIINKALENNIIDIKKFIRDNIIVICNNIQLKEILTFCSDLLKYNIEDRPTMQQVLKNPFLY